MATIPGELGSTLHQETLSGFILIRTDEVDVGERLRPVDPVWAEALGQMMLRDGQDTPILVCRLPGRSRWLLVAGGHRLAGAVSADIAYMRAEVVSADRDDRRLREVRENVMRSDLTPIDRAAHVAEAVAILKRRAGIDPAADGRVGSAAARWQKVVKDEANDATTTIVGAYGFSEAVASDLGFSFRTVENDLLLYRRLAPSVVERLRAARHPVLNNGTQLRALAKLDEHAQAKVVSLLLVPGESLNYGQPKTVGDAIAHALGPKPAGPKQKPDEKRQSTFISTFQRMTLAEQKGALAILGKHLPKGMRIVDGPEPRAEFSAQHVAYREETLASVDEVRGLIDGLIEDEIVTGERGADLDSANAKLGLARFTIAGNGFDMGGGS